MKNIIITGVSGQCGSYFVDYLLENTDYEIYGMVRRLSVKNYKNIEHIKDKRFHLFSGDLNDSHSIYKCLEEIKPDFFVNCAAQSFVAESWITPANTMLTDSVAIIHILEVIRKLVPNCRFLNFGSSEELGDVVYSPQDEKHPARARSIYGVAKIAARQIIKVYRESYNLYAIQPWFYNYESERRGEEIVTRKITLGVARINNAIKNREMFDPISLGNVNSQRDWSYCLDMVDGAWKSLNQDKNNVKEYIFSSNETRSIKNFVEKAFLEAGIDGYWSNSILDERFERYILPNYIIENNNLKSYVLVDIDEKFFRPADVEKLWGDSNLARKELDWHPKVSFDELISKMVKNDIENFIPPTKS